MIRTIAIEGSDVAFVCEPGQSVLDAALHAGIELPYSCRKGACANCAGEVASGRVVALAGGSVRNEMCSPQQVLYCQCTPVADVVLRPSTWRRAEPGARRAFDVKVYRNTRVAPDVSVLNLRLANGRRAKFHAGQYLQVVLEDGERRSFSMANAPRRSDCVVLHVRHYEGGRFSGNVAALVPGQALRIEVPFGNVRLPISTRPLLLIAGGTGFAPIQSIIDDLLDQGDARPLTLMWAVRGPEQLYLREAIERWQVRRPDMRFVAAFSQAPDARVGAPFVSFDGRADQALSAIFPDLRGHDVYCCGSPAMVTALRDVAGRSGLEAANFHADVFAPGPAVA